jgi:hypothetical protein
VHMSASSDQLSSAAALGPARSLPVARSTVGGVVQRGQRAMAGHCRTWQDIAEESYTKCEFLAQDLQVSIVDCWAGSCSVHIRIVHC